MEDENVNNLKSIFSPLKVDEYEFNHIHDMQLTVNNSYPITTSFWFDRKARKITKKKILKFFVTCEGFATRHKFFSLQFSLASLFASFLNIHCSKKENFSKK